MALGIAVARRDRRNSTSTVPSAASPVASPPADRGRTSRWRDTRLLLGLGIVTGCVLLGVRLVAGADARVAVWAAARDLPAGATPAAADLVPVLVALDAAAGAYLPTAESPASRLTRPVLAGELLPRAALGGARPEGIRLVTVPVEPLHGPAGLAPGDRVEVWATPKDPTGTGIGRPARVLDDVVVAAVATDAAAATGDAGVVLEVPQEAVPAVVAATRSGAVDLVRIPA